MSDSFGSAFSSSLWSLPSGKTTSLIETRTSGPRKLVITRETAFNYQIFLEYLIDNLIAIPPNQLTIPSFYRSRLASKLEGGELKRVAIIGYPFRVVKFVKNISHEIVLNFDCTKLWTSQKFRFKECDLEGNWIEKVRKKI